MMDDNRDFEFALFPILRSQSSVNYFGEILGASGQIDHWANQTFHPRRKKYIVDVVAYLRDGSILHIEQETSPDSDMPVRMLEYSTAITIDAGLERRIRQVLFYTGDRPKYGRSPKGEWPATFLARYELGYLRFRYLIVDSGRPDPGRIARVDFPAAALGLLARQEGLARQVANILADRIGGLAGEERRKALVACNNVLRLGRWRPMFEAALKRAGVTNVPVNDTARDYADSIVAELVDVARNAITYAGHFDADDLDRALPEELRYDEVRRLAALAGLCNSIEDLLSRCDIEPRNRHGVEGP